MTTTPATESGAITLKKGVRTFRKSTIASPNHGYPTLHRTGNCLEQDQVITLGPVEQVLYDHRVRQAREVTSIPGTFVLVEEMVYTLQEASLVLLRRFMEVVPKQQCPKCGGTGVYLGEVDGDGNTGPVTCHCDDPNIGKLFPADVSLVEDLKELIGISKT
jgi:hypothetical protein